MKKTKQKLVVVSDKNKDESAYDDSFMIMLQFSNATMDMNYTLSVEVCNAVEPGMLQNIFN